ncbi:MAG: hypothetical protein ABEN55_06705 [Bradymonadaceae bacterium]
MSDEHEVTLLDSYTPAELRTMGPGEEMRHLLSTGEAFEEHEGLIPIDDAFELILEHVDDHEVLAGDPSIARLELNGHRFEVIASHYRPSVVEEVGISRALDCAKDAYLAVCRAYLRLLKAGAERGGSDLRGMAEREAMTE